MSGAEDRPTGGMAGAAREGVGLLKVGFAANTACHPDDAPTLTDANHGPLKAGVSG